MPERNIEFGAYGARGLKGHEAVARQLDELAAFIATPITARRGVAARLHYLTRTDHALRAARAAGLTVTDDTIRKWLQGKRRPSRKNLERIEAAYRTVRRHNVARYLLARLNREGRGTRVEFHPVNQSQVDRPRQRAVSFRMLNVRHWDRIVDAWAHDDQQALDDAWVNDAAVDLGSEWGQYEYVTNIGFAA
ncbi:transcriptional regulator [Streptomyces fructofermentans]|uniref:transcriptional regulator n=1 Tax=Streptomyces fructofermentans TaxID=152141 RepID=UPI00340C7B95